MADISKISVNGSIYDIKDTTSRNQLVVATSTTNGFMSSTDKTKLDGIASGANNYSLPKATSSTLGGVKIGSGISVDSNGVISASTGGGTWGTISGTLSNQTDLQTALNSKATATELNNYLPLSGGTMTGNINYQISTIDSTSTPESSINEHILYILDSNGNPIGNIESSLNTEGDILFKFGVVKNINNTNVFNNITCRIRSDGTSDYILKSPPAFRNALEITDIATRPDYIVSTVDLTDGTSSLTTGTLYFYYEV